MPHSHAPRNPFEGVTDFFSELSRMREIGTHGREHGHEDRQRTHASAWVPATDIFAQGERPGDQGRARRGGPGGHRPALRQRRAHGVGQPQHRSCDGDGEPTFYVRERFYGEFRRSITLPRAPSRSQITAEFDDGLVEIVVAGAVKQADSTRIELRDRSTGATRRSLG